MLRSTSITCFFLAAIMQISAHDLKANTYTTYTGTIAPELAGLTDPEKEVVCRYFLANHSGTNSTDIYELFLNKFTFHANMVWIKTVNQKVSISCNLPNEQLYLIRETSPLYQALDVSIPNGSLGFSLIVATGVAGFSGAVCGADGRIYACSEESNKVYWYQPNTEEAEIFSNAQVGSGDLAFGADGRLFLASATPPAAYEVILGEPNIFLGNIHHGSTGLALLDNGNFILSVAGDSLLYVGNDQAEDQGVAYTLKLDGVTFVHSSGDLASGCDTNNGANLTFSNTIPEAASVRVVPSLTEAMTTIHLTPAHSSYARLEVFDMQGRSVQVLLDRVTEPGQAYIFNFDGGHLPNGVYICQYIADGVRAVEKFVIAK